MNLFSALCVVTAAGLTVVLVRSLTGRPAIGIAAGIVLALTEVSWRIATHADAHSLHLALLALLLVLLVGWERRSTAGTGSESAAPGTRPRADRWLIAAAATYAVAVANHSLALLVGPGILLFVFNVEPTILHRRGLVVRCVGTFAAVGLVFLGAAAPGGPFRPRSSTARPGDLGGFWYVVLAEQFRGDLGSPLTDLVRSSTPSSTLPPANSGRSRRSCRSGWWRRPSGGVPTRSSPCPRSRSPASSRCRTRTRISTATTLARSSSRSPGWRSSGRGSWTSSESSGPAPPARSRPGASSHSICWSLRSSPARRWRRSGPWALPSTGAAMSAPPPG